MIWVCGLALTRIVANLSIAHPNGEPGHYNMQGRVGKAVSLKILLPVIKKSDHARHKKGVAIAAKSVRL